ncbi:5954_t:CDS:2 [Paraglomus brasilianum]|uniref:5954_t:CDS:1 n=1 Tax=Paraglomus brasilianum TaxID=144538 RepID=A0A9N8Z1S1_9GLOM|nr:5954_t:CDS:2 [Paraglomus brasilianum]
MGSCKHTLARYEPLPDWPIKKSDPSALDNFYDSTKSKEETEEETEEDNEEENEEAEVEVTPASSEENGTDYQQM